MVPGIFWVPLACTVTFRDAALMLKQGLGGSYVVPGMALGLVMCKASTVILITVQTSEFLLIM